MNKANLTADNVGRRGRNRSRTDFRLIRRGEGRREQGAGTNRRIAARAEPGTQADNILRDSGADDADKTIRKTRAICGRWLEKEAFSADQFVLEPDEVHLWRVSLRSSDESVNEFAQTLSADERQRADRFRFTTHRRRFVVGRGVLRALLGQYLGRAPADLEFAYGVNGKPSLAGLANARRIFFNASQSEDSALVAVTWTGEIGIDVEHVRAVSDWTEIAQRILTPDREAVPPATVHEFVHEWTRHEARVKATGEGLGGEAAGEPEWVVRSFSLEKDLIAAVAFPTRVRHFTCRHWCGF